MFERQTVKGHERNRHAVAEVAASYYYVLFPFSYLLDQLSCSYRSPNMCPKQRTSEDSGGIVIGAEECPHEVDHTRSFTSDSLVWNEPHSLSLDCIVIWKAEKTFIG